MSEEFLIERGLSNYWGYNTIGFFALQANNSQRCGEVSRVVEVDEFSVMVDGLHGVGLEVVLEVVFNYIVEGGVGVLTLCFSGLDNSVYYRLDVVD